MFYTIIDEKGHFRYRFNEHINYLKKRNYKNTVLLIIIELVDIISISAAVTVSTNKIFLQC